MPKAAPGISTPEINTGSLHRLFRLTGNRLLRGGNKRKKKETLLPSSFLPPILQLNNNKASSFAAHRRIKILLLSFLEEKFSFDRDVKTVADSFPPLRLKPICPALNAAILTRGVFASGWCTRETNTGRYFFLSTTRAAAIWRRPICRGAGIGRHRAGYLGTERGTITNINIRRPRSLWWYGVRRRAVPLPRISRPLQHPPCPCQEGRIHLPSSSSPSRPSSTVPFFDSTRRSFTRFASNKNSHVAKRGGGDGGC